MKAAGAKFAMGPTKVTVEDRDSRLRGLSAGAEDFLLKPVDRMELSVRVKNLARLKRYGDMLELNNQRLADEVAQKTEELRASYLDTILTLIRAAEYRDSEMGALVQRISQYSAVLSERLGMDTTFVDTIRHASPMHDVGKIGIPDNILLKRGPFDADEWRIMRSHATLGGLILRSGRSPYLRMGAQIAEAHHERWDGSGYPNGLSGEAIPLAARVMTLCDQYDAPRSARPYKPGLPHDQALCILSEGDGRTLPSHFDPEVLNTFLSSASLMRDIFESVVDRQDSGRGESSHPPETRP